MYFCSVAWNPLEGLPFGPSRCWYRIPASKPSGSQGGTAASWDRTCRGSSRSLGQTPPSKAKLWEIPVIEGSLSTRIAQHLARDVPVRCKVYTSIYTQIYICIYICHISIYVQTDVHVHSQRTHPLEEESRDLSYSNLSCSCDTAWQQTGSAGPPANQRRVGQRQNPNTQTVVLLKYTNIINIQGKYCLRNHWIKNERLWILEPNFKSLLLQGAFELRS